jgi:hypothetical protein
MAGLSWRKFEPGSLLCSINGPGVSPATEKRREIAYAFDSSTDGLNCCRDIAVVGE